VADVQARWRGSGSLAGRLFPAAGVARTVTGGLLLGAGGYAGLALAVRGGGDVGWAMELALTAFGTLYLSLRGGSAHAAAVTFAVLGGFAALGAVPAAFLPGFLRR
jgi:hypothetical protein